MKNLLQKKHIWVTLGSLILASPLFFFVFRYITGTEGTTIRFLEKSYESDAVYFLSTIFFIIALAAVITSMLILFSSLSYFSIVSMTSKNKTQGSGFIGLFFITIFSGGITFLAIYTAPQIMEKMLKVKSLYHEIIITEDSNLIFYHDIKGQIFKQHKDQLLGLSATCRRFDKVLYNSRGAIKKKGIEIVYSYEFLFRFMHNDMVETFRETTNAKNSAHIVYKNLTPLVEFFNNSVPVKFTQCPSIEEYEPGFIRNRPLKGSASWVFTGDSSSLKDSPMNPSRGSSTAPSKSTLKESETNSD